MKFNVSELRSVINIYSNTSGNLLGEITCRRADYTITIPTACMLDDTKVTLRTD